VVVGGGPAGASCALSAAKAGLNVVLIEGEPMPRTKLCGGGLTQKSMRFLQSRGLLRNELILSSCDEMDVMFANGSQVSLKSMEPLVSVVHRSTFDKSLVDHAADAGAEVIAGDIFNRAQFADKISVHTTKHTMKTRYLVGADGVNSAVARSAMLWSEWPTLKTALGLETDVPRPNDFNPAKIQIWIGDWSGYTWIFPRGDTLDVGIIGPKSSASILVASLEEFMSQHGYSGRVKGWHLPIAGYGPTPNVAGKNVILVGDAAGTTDPWFGEGIYFALETGELAANACLEENPTRTYLRSYRDLWGDMKWAGRFAKGFYEHRSFVPYFFQNNHEIQTLLERLLSGEITFRQLYFRVGLQSPRYALSFLLNRMIGRRTNFA